MLCARVVSNNRPDEVEKDGIVLKLISRIEIDDHSGAIVLQGLDGAFDPIEITASAPWTT